MKKQRILHILNTNSYSGAENVVITLVRGFRQMKLNHFEFIYVSLEGPIRNILSNEQIAFEPISKMSTKEIKRVINKYRPSVIHAHDFTASIICSIATVKIPVISHIHNNSPWIKKICIKSIAYGLSCIRYKYMLGVSKSVFDEFVYGKFFRDKQRIIGNPISMAAIIAKAEAIKCDERFDVIFLGRLSLQKNPVLFIEIIEEIVKIKPIKAVMVGDGEMRNEVESEIMKRNLNDSICLKGFMKNPYGILKQSKILCVTSSWEGYGLVAAEALALGKPVISTGVGGLRDIVNDKCGKICIQKEEFIDAILGLLTSETLYKSKAKGAIDRARELDNIQQYITEIEKLYHNVIKY